MRDQSVSLRILVLAVLLLFVTALCVVTLVVVGALSPRIAHMGVVGGAILIVAILAAAISVFTPKYRPTPLLTPLFAGVFAALFASAAIYGVQAHVASKRGAVAAVAAKSATEPVKPAPVVEKASASTDLQPAPQEPAPAVVPGFDGSDFGTTPMPAQAEAPAPVQAEAPAPPDVQPAETTDVQPLPTDTAGAAATDTTPVATADAAAPPAAAVDQPAATEGATKAPVAVAKIPVPAPAPAAPARQTAGAPVNLTGGFDASGPTVPEAAGPPMALDAAGVVQPRRVVIPPLPRIRPCGGAGPACP